MRITIALLLFVTTFQGWAQNAYKQNFEQLIQAGEWEAVPSLLATWEKDTPTDAELFVAQFNYFFHESRQEVVQVSEVAPETEHLVMTDTASGDTTGYMYSELVYNDSIFDLGIQAIDNGLELYPRRLDMHFGKIYTLKERGRIEDHVNTIIAVINLHSKYHERWLWTNGEPVKDPNELFTSSIQDYCYALFNLPEAHLTGVEEISNLMTQLYPGDVRFYSNLGACKLMVKDYPSALDYFMTANQKVSDDVVVFSNIAYTYRLMEDRPNAILWYDKLAQIGTDEQATFARQQIKDLEVE